MTAQNVPTIFSPARLAQRRARAKALQEARPEAASWLAEQVTEDVLDRLSFMRAEPGNALIVGLGAELIGRPLRGDGASVIVSEAGTPDAAELVGADYDLIAVLTELDTENDLPGTLIQYRAALSPRGLFMATIVGAGSLPVLRRIMLAADDERPAPRIHPQIDNRAATMLLERAGFARQVVDSASLTVRYSSLSRLIGDLREQGLGSALSDRSPCLGKAAFRRAESAFARLAEEDGKVSEHFELLTLTGWNS